jgi:hypothetical protein
MTMIFPLTPGPLVNEVIAFPFAAVERMTLAPHSLRRSPDGFAIGYQCNALANFFMTLRCLSFRNINSL